MRRPCLSTELNLFLRTYHLLLSAHEGCLHVALDSIVVNLNPAIGRTDLCGSCSCRDHAHYGGGLICFGTDIGIRIEAVLAAGAAVSGVAAAGAVVSGVTATGAVVSGVTAWGSAAGAWAAGAAVSCGLSVIDSS